MNCIVLYAIPETLHYYSECNAGNKKAHVT